MFLDGTNDVLDLPLLPQKVVDLRLVDQVGAPIPSIGVTFSLPDGDVPLTTDSNGAARIVNPPGDVLPVKFDDPDSLRATLKAGQRERMLLSVPIDPAFPWTDDDSVSVLAANSAVVVQKRIGDGLALGATQVFRIPRHEVGKLYRAEVHVQQDTFVLFDQLPSTSNGDAVMRSGQ